MTDWTVCKNCGSKHLGLKFVSECQGVPLRCPECKFGAMRDMTAEEIQAVREAEKESRSRSERRRGQDH